MKLSFTWLKRLFFRNGKKDDTSDSDISSVPSLKECSENAPAFKGKCVDRHSGEVQAKLAYVNASFDDMEDDQILDDWTDPGV